MFHRPPPADTVLRFLGKHTILFWKPRTRKTQRGADNIDMFDSIEGENALALFADERSVEDFQGGDDDTGM
jgi:hypothetical protein